MRQTKRRPIMSQTEDFSILQAFFTFRARLFQLTARDRIKEQMKHYLPHLAADICALPALDERL